MHARIRADYKNTIEDTRKAALSGGGTVDVDVEVIRIQKDYELGQGMDKLIRLQLARPDAPDDELLNAIPPPMRFINYGLREIRPSENPKEDFETNERLNIRFIEQRGIDLSKSKELTHLLIPPNTTKNELRDFIDGYYDDAKKLIDAGRVYFESAKNTQQRITRVTEESIIDERIHELRNTGVMPKDIAPLINQEFDKDLEPFEVSKRLSQMKRRKSRQ